MTSLQKAPDPDGCMGKFVQILNKEIPRQEGHQSIETSGRVPSLLYKANITLILKSTNNDKKWKHSTVWLQKQAM